MSEYTIDKFTYNGNTYNLAGGGGSTIGFVDANSSLSDVISTCQNNDFVFYATSDTSYLPLLYYGAESGDEYAGFGIIAPINDPGKYGETAGKLYYIDVNSDGWVQSESFLYESVGYVYYGETTYSDALDIIDKHDITYCVYTTGTSPNTITYYYPLTYFDDGYDTIGFSLPDSLSPDVNKIEIKELSLNSDNYWGTGTRTCVSNIKQTFYGTCATIASTATKVVSCAGFSLNSGTIIGIRFRFGNTTNAPKLNVNSTGEKDILVGDTYVASSNVLKWSDYAVIYFMYDGTYFKYMCSVASSSQEQPRGANTWYGTSSTTAGTGAKTSTIENYVLTKGAVVNITFTEGNTANALTLNVNSTGAKAIYYNNAATSSSNKLTWNANETVTFVYTGSYYYFLGEKDEKLYVGNMVSNTDYSPVCMTSVGTIPRTSTALLADEFRITKNTNDGVTDLVIGSSQGQRGRIKLGYRVDGNNHYVTTLTTSHTNADRTLTLPDATGTVALTSDIPTVPTKVSDLTNDSGFVTTDEKVKTENYNTADSTAHPIVFNKNSTVATTESKYATGDLTFSKNDSNYATLAIGNNASMRGRLQINTGDGNSGNYTYLISSATDSKTITLPDASGTIALTSDITKVQIVRW